MKCVRKDLMKGKQTYKNNNKKNKTILIQYEKNTVLIIFMIKMVSNNYKTHTKKINTNEILKKGNKSNEKKNGDNNIRYTLIR